MKLNCVAQPTMLSVVVYAPSMTMLCSCEMADSSFSHSSRMTAHRARSRIRSLVAFRWNCGEWAEPRIVDVIDDMSSSEAGCSDDADDDVAAND